MTAKKPLHNWLLPALIAAAVAWPASGQAQSDPMEPEAVNLLRRSTAYLAGLKQFRVDTHSSVESVMSNGQKLQFDHRAIMTVQRPNKLRAERVGELVSQVAYYDGKSITIDMSKDGFFATSPAPATLEPALDFARDELQVIAPAGDLVYKNAFELLTSGLTAAYFVGEVMVAGVRCDHLAFRNNEVDWQIYIEQGDKPLPRKYVITSKRMAQSPSFSVVMSKWETAPKINDAMFTFTPAKAASKIEFIPATKK